MFSKRLEDFWEYELTRYAREYGLSHNHEGDKTHMLVVADDSFISSFIRMLVKQKGIVPEEDISSYCEHTSITTVEMDFRSHKGRVLKYGDRRHWNAWRRQRTAELTAAEQKAAEQRAAAVEAAIEQNAVYRSQRRSM